MESYLSAPLLFPGNCTDVVLYYSSDSSAWWSCDVSFDLQNGNYGVCLRLGHFSVRGWTFGYLRKNSGLILMLANRGCMSWLSWELFVSGQDLNPVPPTRPTYFSCCKKYMCLHSDDVLVMANLFCCDSASHSRKVTDRPCTWNRRGIYINSRRVNLSTQAQCQG